MIKYGIECEWTGGYRGRSSRKEYKLLEDVRVGIWGVPAGFITDFISAPRYLLFFLPLKKMARAAVVHDYIMNMTEVPNETATKVFVEILKTDGVNPFVRLGARLYLNRKGAPRVKWPQPYLGQP